jgi:hypothetical protein
MPFGIERKPRVPFEAIRKAVEGTFAENVPQASEALRYRIQGINDFGYIDQNRSNEYWTAYNESLVERGKYLMNVYAETLRKLGVSRPRGSLEEQIRSHITVFTNAFVTAHNEQVEQFAAHTGLPINHELIKHGIEVFQRAIEGRTEMMLHGGAGGVGAKEFAKSKEGDKAKTWSDYKFAIISAVVVGLVGIGGTAVSKFYIEPRSQEREQLEKRQLFVLDSVLTRLDSLVVLGDRTVVMARIDTTKDFRKFSERVSAFEAAYELVQYRRPFWDRQVQQAFDSATSEQAFQVMGTGADSANGIIVSVFRRVEERNRHDIDSVAVIARERLSHYSQSVDALRRLVAKGLVK